MPRMFFPRNLEPLDPEVDVVDAIDFGNSFGSQSAKAMALFGNSAVSMLLSATWFGSGVDGDLELDEPIVLSSDAHFRDLKLIAGGSIDTNNYRLFVSGALDLTSADAGAIHANGVDGANATGSTVETPTGITGGSFPQRPAAGQGEGGFAANQTHNNIENWNYVSNIHIAGGIGGFGGIGGGGYTVSYTTPTPIVADILTPMFSPSAISSSPIYSAVAGLGGWGGTAGASSTGGAGGNGGGAGGFLWVGASRILWGTNETVAVLQANGGNGGNGGNGTGANASGGGGGGGGGGGFVHLIFGSDDRHEDPHRTSVGNTLLISMNGGTGGTGGTKTGTGTSGANGNNGVSGSMLVYEVGSGNLRFVRDDDPTQLFSTTIPL